MGLIQRADVPGRSDNIADKPIGPPPMKRRTKLYNSTYQLTYHEVSSQCVSPVCMG